MRVKWTGSPSSHHFYAGDLVRSGARIPCPSKRCSVFLVEEPSSVMLLSTRNEDVDVS